ncbi:MAG: Gfo/Idh/MocA family oxidoreductase [Candidatus Hydrogenedentes bacterium]|nr:Gfo/Idh/MocA family oxidoreductase [Candidatus Hydrogenedentota bacterium]
MERKKGREDVRGKGLSRRQFLGRSAAVAAGAVGFPYIVPASALGLNGTVAPSNRIVMGCIGVGGQGTYNMTAFLGQPDAQVVAVCDVDTKHRAGAKEKVEQTYAAQKADGSYKGCDEYGDFRELLAREDIDAVTICTPDFWHPIVAVAAAKAGKDMYCEKPLANSIGEGRAVCNAVAQYGRVFQTGSHERSRDNARYACELVRNGRIGKLHTIRCNLPIDNHAPIGPQPVMPVPEELDYDMWLGPAPCAPYTEKRCHFYFRYILDYSGGEVTDRGAHIIDLGQLGNKTDHTGPISVEGTGDFPRDGLFNTAMGYHFEFEYANGVRMICESSGTRGIKFEGTDGWIFIFIHGGNLSASSPALLKEIIGPNEEHLGRSPGHHRDFLNNVKLRGTTFAPPEVGHRTGSMCHLANIAMKLGRKLRWDPDKEQFIGDEEANRRIMPSLRAPWRVV